MEKEAGQAEEVEDQGVVGDLLTCLLLQPVDHSLGLQAELWENVDRGRFATPSRTNKGCDSSKDGRIVLVCACLLINNT